MTFSAFAKSCSERLDVDFRRVLARAAALVLLGGMADTSDIEERRMLMDAHKIICITITTKGS